MAKPALVNTMAKRLTTRNSWRSKWPSLSWSANSQILINVSSGKSYFMSTGRASPPGTSPPTGFNLSNSLSYLRRSTWLMDQSKEFDGGTLWIFIGIMFGISPCKHKQMKRKQWLIMVNNLFIIKPATCDGLPVWVVSLAPDKYCSCLCPVQPVPTQ